MNGLVISNNTTMRIVGGATAQPAAVETRTITIFSTSANEYALATINHIFSGGLLAGGGVTGRILVNTSIFAESSTPGVGVDVESGFVEVLVPPLSSLIIQTVGVVDVALQRYVLSYVKFINSP